MVMGALIFVTGVTAIILSRVAIEEDVDLLPVHNHIELLVGVVAGFVFSALGVLLFVRSNGHLKTKFLRRALCDLRKPVMILGALEFEPFRKVAEMGDEVAVMQSEFSQIVSLLQLAGPVVAVGAPGSRPYGEKVAIVGCSRDRHDEIISTVAVNSQFSVLVMSDSDQLQHDLAKLMSIISLRPSTIFLVPNTDKTYEAVKRAHPEWGLPSLENKLQSRLRFGFSLVWAIVPSGDTWSVVDLSSDDNVEHAGIWIGQKLRGFQDVRPKRVRNIRLRIWVIPVLRYAVGVILLVVSVGAIWGVLHS